MGRTFPAIVRDMALPGTLVVSLPHSARGARLTFSDSIDSMIEFDGYLWAAAWFYVYRSPDDGATWECVPVLPRLGEAYDWAVLNNRLYVAGGHGFVRWNEGELAWDDLNNGLPDLPDLRSLAVYRGRIFAAVRASSMISPGAYMSVVHGVYVFDEQSETWFPARPGRRGGILGRIRSILSLCLDVQGHLPRLNPDRAFLRQSRDHLGCR